MDYDPDFAAAEPSFDGLPPRAQGGAPLPSPRSPRPERRGGSFWPWLLLALAVAGGGWATFFVVLPLRQETLACQEQLREALLAALSNEAPSVAAAEPAAIAPADGAADTRAGDALLAALSARLAAFVDAGAASVHPEEGRVRVIVTEPRAEADARARIFFDVADVVAQEGAPWCLQVQMGRARKAQPEGERAKGRSRVGRRRGARGLPTGEGALTVLLNRIDAAFTPKNVAWSITLETLPLGDVVLVLSPRDGR